MDEGQQSNANINTTDENNDKNEPEIVVSGDSAVIETGKEKEEFEKELEQVGCGLPFEWWRKPKLQNFVYRFVRDLFYLMHSNYNSNLLFQL